MEDTQYILIADYVPLANKGEEAIIRGIEDMLRDDRPTEIGLFDNVSEVTRLGNVTLFPRRWIFRVEGETLSGPLPRLRKIMRDVSVCAQLRAGYHGRLGRLVSSGSGKYGPLQEYFKRADYVLVGHDGVFCTESCGIIHLARQGGKRVGILGAGVPLRWYRRAYQRWLFRRAISESDFCVFRERSSYEHMKRISDDKGKPMLAPDPAFAMEPAAPAAALEVLEEYEPYVKAREAGKEIVAATVLETGVVFTFFMPGADFAVKRRAHAEYLAEIFDSLISERNAFIIFLPHSIEEGISDLTAARNVVGAMSSGPECRMILDRDLGSRVLKGIIKQCDFIVGERAHSLIGAVSVATAFLALTNLHDLRMYDILGRMCKGEDQIVDMNAMDGKAAARKALEVFDRRLAIRERLEDTGRSFREELGRVSRAVKGVTAREGTA